MNKDVEIFKDIPGYEGLYQVSNLGRVYSLPKEWVNGFGGLVSHNGKFLKLGIGSNGYLLVKLYNEGKQKTKNVHQLVAMTFLNHEPDGYKIVIDHKDNDKSNNNVNNLQLISNRENSSKDKKGGTSKYIGVHWDKRNNKWRSEITINGKTKYIGLFKCELEASAAYQKVLSKVENNIEIEVKEVVFSSKYKGVHWDKNNNKWVSKIIVNGKTKFLGRFNCELEAHHAYQKALNEYNKYQSTIC